MLATWRMHLQNLRVTQENAPLVLFTVCHRQNVLWPKSLCCPRGTCLWSQCMKHTTNNWQEKQTEKKTNKQNDNKKKETNIIIIKTFFPGMKLNRKCTTKLGEFNHGNILVSVKIKPLFLICSCSLSIQTLDSVPMHVSFLEHCDTKLCLNLLQNINDNTYNNTHTHFTLFKPSPLKRFQTGGAWEQSEGAEPHVMWKSLGV